MLVRDGGSDGCTAGLSQRRSGRSGSTAAVGTPIRGGSPGDDGGARIVGVVVVSLTVVSPRHLLDRAPEADHHLAESLDTCRPTRLGHGTIILFRLGGHAFIHTRDGDSQTVASRSLPRDA